MQPGLETLAAETKLRSPLREKTHDEQFAACRDRFRAFCEFVGFAGPINTGATRTSDLDSSGASFVDA